MIQGVYGGDQYQAQPPVVHPQGSGFWSFVWNVFIVGLIGGVLWFAYKLFTKKEKPTMIDVNNSMAHVTNKLKKTIGTHKTELTDIMEDFFVDFQNSNRPSGLQFIKDNTTNLMFNAVKSSIMAEPESREVRIDSLTSELIEFVDEGSSTFGSVKFTAKMYETFNGAETNVSCNEIWNFKYTDGKWLLAGIDKI
jgi:hypothetical protein